MMGLLFLLMVYATLQTDLADHLDGWDRTHRGHDKSALQKGWFTGVQIKKWSKVVLFSARLLSVPLLYSHPMVLLPFSMLVLGLLLLIPRWWRRSSFPGLASLCIFMLTGPMLTAGMDIALSGGMSWRSLVLGMVWGLWISYVRQQRIYTRQWPVQDKTSPYSFLGLGFDRSKSLMRILIPTVPAMMLLIMVFVSGGSAWFFPLMVVHAAFGYWELHFNEKVQSSMGSSLKFLQKLFMLHHLVVSLVMIFGAIISKSIL